MARKRLNKSLVIGLSLFTFATMIVLSLLMLKSLAQRDPKYFVELAQKRAAQEDWQQAAAFYNQAWERSNDPTYLVEFGEMMLREGDVQSARIAWTKALLRDPNLVEAHVRQLGLLLRQAKLYGSSQNWESVRDAAKSMLTVVTDADGSAVAHHALGLALIGLRDRGTNTDEELNELRKAYELQPEEVIYPIDLAEELVRREKKDEARELYNSLISKHTQPGPAASKVRTAYAQYLAFLDKKTEAEESFQKSVEMAGEDASSRHEARLAYAGFLIQSWVKAKKSGSEQAQALYESAERIINEAIKDEPSAFDSYVQLASLYRLAGESAKVVDTCEKRIAQGLERKGVEAAQNRLNILTLMTYASEAAVALSVEAGTKKDFAERDRWLVRAEQYVADARGEWSTHPMVLSQSGRVKIARGRERAGLEDLRASDDTFKSYGKVNWDNRLIRARVHLQLNESGAAKALLEEVLTEATRTRSWDSAFWNLYAQSLVQTGELEHAMNVVDRTLTLSPDNKDTKRIKAAIFERQGKQLEAGKIEEELSGSGTIRAILEAKAATMEGDTEKALQLLRHALEAEPADPRIIAALSSELAQLGRLDEARDVVNKALAADPGNTTFKSLELSLRKELTPEDRERELLQLIEAEEDGFRRALSLVSFYAQKNDPARVLAAIDEAEKHIDAGDTPMAKTVTSHQRAALLRTKLRAAYQLKDDAAMASARDVAVRIDVDGAGGKSIIGMYHYLRKEFDLAAQAFRAALEEQPTQTSSWIMLGQCLQALGRNDESREAFSKAIEVNPNEGSAHQGLALLAQLAGDKVTFERELALAERLIPDDAWVREQSLLGKEAANPKAAIALREKQLAAKEEPANVQRLAELYETTGDKEKADRAYDRLLQLLPNESRVANAAAAYYRKSGRGARAIEILRQYMNSRPTPQEQAVAATLVASEQLTQQDAQGAEKTLLDAAEKAPSIEVCYALGSLYQAKLNQPNKSVGWLDKAVEIAVQTKSSTLPTLLERRIACLLDREVNDLQRAREEAAAYRRQYPDNPRGFLIQGEVQARSGEIEQAIASLTDYLTKRPNDVYALTQRAQHLVAQGRLQAAMVDLERIKQTASPAAAAPARIMLAKIHEREGRLDRAIAELESLAGEVQGSNDVSQELISAYIRQKRYSDGERIATGLINRAGDKPDPLWLFLRGQISLELGAADKALADFRRGAEAAGHNSVAVGMVLGAYLRLSEFAKGVQYYEGLGSRDEKDPDVLGKYGQLLARSNRATQAVDVFRSAMSNAMTSSSQQVQSLLGLVIGAFPAKDAVDLFEKTACPPPLARGNDRLLARLYPSVNRLPEAQTKLDGLIQGATSEPEKAALLYEKGEVYQVAEDYLKAVEFYEQSLKFAPDNWYTLNNLAYILSEERGEHAAALVYAKKAVAKADNPYTLDTLGWILVHMSQYDAAVAELSRAIRQNPDYALCYYHLGEAYRRGGRFDEAAQVLEAGLMAAKAGQQADIVTSIETSLPRARARDSAL